MTLSGCAVADTAASVTGPVDSTAAHVTGDVVSGAADVITGSGGKKDSK